MDDTVGDLARLEQEERAVSQRRLRLHERIGFLHGGGFADAESLERLAKLEEEEREVSRQRVALHRRIDALRAQTGVGGVEPGPKPKERLLDAPGAAYVASLYPGFGSLTRDDG